MLPLLTVTHLTVIFCFLTAVSATYSLIYVIVPYLRHSSFVSEWLPRGLPGSDPKRPSNWPARRHKYYFSLVIRLYLIFSIANQLFGPLPSVSYSLRMSSTSSEQVLCALMYEVNSISKNPPATTATAVSIREDRYTAPTDCTECTRPPSIIQGVYRVCWLYPVNQLYRVYRLYRKKVSPLTRNTE